MTLQDASTSDEETNNNIKPKPVKKGKNACGQDQPTPAKKPRHGEIKEKNNHKWKCAICTVGFSFWNELNMHVKNAHEVMNEDQWECEHCGKSYSSKGNLNKHVRIKHKQKKSLIQYECMHCRKTEDTFDAAVHHAQVHLVQEALTKKNGSQYKHAYDNHNDSSLIKITFDYKTLLKDAWFDMFRNLSTSLEIEASSLYRHTRCVKLNWDSRSRHAEQGKFVLLYQCGVCKLIVEPAKVQKHCDNNGACVEGGQGYKCRECKITFYTAKALRRHKERHENNPSLMVKIATFNNKDDVLFNNILKQISRSSVEDTQEDTELEKISRSPGTPENDSLEKNNDVHVSNFDFEAHNVYHENKTNRTMETIVGQIEPSCSVTAGANIVSPGENVSNADNTGKDFLKNRSKVQAHKDNIVEASKDDDSDRIENGNSTVTAWDSDNDSNDSNRQSPAQLNLKKSFGGVFTKKGEILQKNSNDNINSVKSINHDNVPKDGIDRKDQTEQSAFKRRRISGEVNNPGGMLEADDKSQSTKDQRALEDNGESVQSRDNSEENEDFDQCNQEVQEDTGTTANIGAVNKPDNGESGVLESSEYVYLNGNMSILHGSFNQEDLRFNTSRGKQCTGIAAVACAAFCVLDPNAWTKSIIDKIVVIGDKYYNHCITVRSQPAAGEINPEYLAVSDLMPTIIFNKLSVPIAFEEYRNWNGHIDDDDSSRGFPNLKNALKEFFRRHTSGILTSNAISVAVYCKAVGEIYWLFDSHSRGLDGGPALGGAACCMRFSHLDDLHALLRRNLFVSPSEVPKGRDLINSLNVFSLTSVSVREPNGKLA